jgi:hypothetical protein
VSRLRRFGAFWYDFIIGDDWRIALIVVAGLATTAVLVHAGNVNAWWLMPLVVVAALTLSLFQATGWRRHRK